MAATMVVLTVTVSDGDATMPLTDTATQNVTVNPMPVTPVFTNAAAFATPIMTAENLATVMGAGFFAAPADGDTITYVLTGADMSHFTITNAGTLTFNAGPDFEMPRGAAPTDTNTNTYAVGITARSSNNLEAQSGAITIQVTDVNEAPVLATITPPAFTEYAAGTFDITATDEDDGQTLTYTLRGTSHGATLSSTGTFTWTPGEDDGGETRTFNVRDHRLRHPGDVRRRNLRHHRHRAAQSSPDRRHHYRRHDPRRPGHRDAGGDRDGR